MQTFDVCSLSAPAPTEVQTGRARASWSQYAQRVCVHAGAEPHLLVHGDSVKVVHLDVRVRPHRVRHGTCVLGELCGAHRHHVFNALDGARVHVARELAVTVHGEALLERELEPVAARHAVAGPVVEVLVPHDALHAAHHHRHYIQQMHTESKNAAQCTSISKVFETALCNTTMGLVSSLMQMRGSQRRADAQARGAPGCAQSRCQSKSRAWRARGGC
jgi:hypothetical protein